MPDVLLYGDTVRSPALRHEVPISVIDPFLYAEVGGRVAILSWSLEAARLAEARPDAELVDIDTLGFQELRESGRPRTRSGSSSSPGWPGGSASGRRRSTPSSRSAWPSACAPTGSS